MHFFARVFAGTLTVPDALEFLSIVGKRATTTFTSADFLLNMAAGNITYVERIPVLTQRKNVKKMDL